MTDYIEDLADLIESLDEWEFDTLLNEISRDMLTRYVANAVDDVSKLDRSYSDLRKMGDDIYGRRSQKNRRFGTRRNKPSKISAKDIEDLADKIRMKSGDRKRHISNAMYRLSR